MLDVRELTTGSRVTFATTGSIGAIGGGVNDGPEFGAGDSGNRNGDIDDTDDE